MSEEPKIGYIEVYIDAAGEYRWRRKAPNGKIIATGAEGYHNLGDAQASMLAACGGLATTRIVFLGKGDTPETPPQDTPPRE